MFICMYERIHMYVCISIHIWVGTRKTSKALNKSEEERKKT